MPHEYRTESLGGSDKQECLPTPRRSPQQSPNEPKPNPVTFLAIGHLTRESKALRVLKGVGILVHVRVAPRRTMSDRRPEGKEFEAELIRRICSGDREPFAILIQPYQRAVYSTAYAITGNATDAEDVAQEVFLKALRALPGFRAEARFSTWLVQIAMNEARMLLRRKRAKQYESLDAGAERDEGDYRPRDFADWREIPSEALARKELREALMHAISALKPIYRDVLILRDLRGLSVREAAAVLEVSEEVVKTRLLRARLQLRDALAPGYDGSWTTGAATYKKVRPW